MDRDYAVKRLLEWLGKKNGEQWISHGHDEVFERFRLKYKDAVEYGNEKTKMLFREGNGAKKVILVAHADAYFESGAKRIKKRQMPEFIKRDNIVSHVNPSSARNGFGADDRAGCAMIDLLCENDKRHSFIITNWEEDSGMGAAAAVQGTNTEGKNYSNPGRDSLVKKLGQHQFIVGLDRKKDDGVEPYVVYYDKEREGRKHKTINNEFNEYLLSEGFEKIESGLMSDVWRFSEITKLCGINISIGYENDHTDNEKLDIDAWWKTLTRVESWLGNGDMPRVVL